MRPTPFGYDIVDGRPVINEEQANVIRKLCDNYLSGMSYDVAAKDAGITIVHSSVKRMFQNKKYLGDDLYPAILTKEIMDKIEEERIRREKKLGRDHRKKKEPVQAKIVTCFSAPRITQIYSDPIKQAEFAYSQIRNEVSG